MYMYPRINAYLSDKNGRPICPYQPGAIQYTNLLLPEEYPSKQLLLSSGDTVRCLLTAVLINGYITVPTCGNKIRKIVPFSMSNCILLPPEGSINTRFKTNDFCCSAVPALDRACRPSGYIKIYAYVDAMVFPKTEPNSGQNDCQGVSFQSCTNFFYNMQAIRANVYQYNAISNGQKKIYVNQDELKQYGNKGLISPDDTSMQQLFINGAIQPNTNYALEKGKLELRTEDVPKAGEPISVSYVTLTGRKNEILDTNNDFYVAVADGSKSIYTNDDALLEYGYKGIPSPQEVSFFNLFVNGVLQPKTVYKIRKGVFTALRGPPRRKIYRFRISDGEKPLKYHAFSDKANGQY